jgi:putative flippase GtrA
MRRLILSMIDFFYPPFKRIIPLQTFRYAACGGGNVLLDFIIWYITYNFILEREILDLGFYAFQPYTAALVIAFCFTFPVGFLLSKYIVFNESYLRGRIQLFRYVLVVITNLLLNYGLMKMMIEHFEFWPSIARLFTIIIIVTFSYLSQKHFTFRNKPLRGARREA